MSKFVLVHGAFDHCNQADSGIEVLADRLRKLGHEVTTWECDEDKDDMPTIASGYLSYSNGCDKVMEMLDELGISMRILIFLDPCWKNFWSRAWQTPFFIPMSVTECTAFRRNSNWWIPRSSPTLREKPPKDADPDEVAKIKPVITIPVNLDHGDVPKDRAVQDKVIELFSSVA